MGKDSTPSLPRITSVRCDDLRRLGHHCFYLFWHSFLLCRPDVPSIGKWQRDRDLVSVLPFVATWTLRLDSSPIGAPLASQLVALSMSSGIPCFRSRCLVTPVL